MKKVKVLLEKKHTLIDNGYILLCFKNLYLHLTFTYIKSRQKLDHLSYTYIDIKKCRRKTSWEIKETFESEKVVRVNTIIPTL